MSASTPSRYPLARAAGVLALGGLAVAGGVLVVALAVVQSVRGAGAGWSVAWWAVLILAAAVGLGLLRAVWLLVRAPVALRLDDTGYAVSDRAGAGVRTAAWADVARVRAVEGGSGGGVVVELEDGRSTRIVARMLADPRATWVADLEARLDRAHGQRRL